MLLDVNNLTVTVGDNGPRILDNVSFAVPEKSVVALVGGSGSGKTTAGLAVLRLLPPALRMAGGRIDFQGRDMLSLDAGDLRQVRGGEISMVFQEPLDAFNPVYRIGEQIREVLQYHTDVAPRDYDRRTGELLTMAGLKEPERVARSYPHQLSGGMRQRAMTAMALAAEPRLLIADEPTSNLDVTLQARILELFRELVQDLSLSLLLITHDLGVVEHLADSVIVMSSGRVVESGPVAQVLSAPQQDYTRELLAAARL